jgi:hypothetical protein
MYLTAERLAHANQEVQETFAQASVAWQAIPHWDTGDPAQGQVRADPTSVALNPPPPPPYPNPAPLGANPIPIHVFNVQFDVTLAQATAANPDALFAAIIARTVYMANWVDSEVAEKLVDASNPKPADIKKAADENDLLSVLIDARVAVEQYGYRAPSCLLADTIGLKALTRFDNGYSFLSALLDASRVNSLHRIEKIVATGGAAPAANKGRLLLLGRRQLIAQGGAPMASPGEEPVDLAVSVPPSLEVIGETATGNISLAVRTHLAVRVKDAHGVVGVQGA